MEARLACTPWITGDDVGDIQTQLHQMSGILQQLRAAARLETDNRSNRGSVFQRIGGRPAKLITPQAPSAAERDF